MVDPGVPEPLLLGHRLPSQGVVALGGEVALGVDRAGGAVGRDGLGGAVVRPGARTGVTEPAVAGGTALGGPVGVPVTPSGCVPSASR